MCSMIQAGYAMLFFECLRLELCMIVMETTNTTRRTLEERIKNSNLKIASMILTFSQVRKEILKVAPLEVDQGDPHAGRLRVLMMYDFYFYFSCKRKGNVP